MSRKFLIRRNFNFVRSGQNNPIVQWHWNLIRGPIIVGPKAGKPYEIQPNAAMPNEIKRDDAAAMAKRHETPKAIYLLIRELIARSKLMCQSKAFSTSIYTLEACKILQRQCVYTQIFFTYTLFYKNTYIFFEPRYFTSFLNGARFRNIVLMTPRPDTSTSRHIA